VAFKQQNDIISVDGKRIDEQNLTNLNERLGATRNRSLELLARFTRLESIIRNWNPKTSSIADIGTYSKQDPGNLKPSIDGSISDELGSPIITSLHQQYQDLSRRETEWSTRYGREHGAVVDLRNRLVGLRTSAFEELRRIAAVLKNDYAIAQQQQAEIEKQLERVISQAQTLDNASVSLQELESNASTYRSLYESFLKKIHWRGAARLLSAHRNSTDFFCFSTFNNSKAQALTCLRAFP
jgi:uncharacterized protein involved in exopolysaccharide biosynthesis